MKVTLLVPTFNELEGMKAVMPRVKKEWVDEILVVDGGTDGTAEYARQMGYRVIVQKSKGLFAAYQEAVEAAIGDVIITFSPDGNSVPEKIPELAAKLKEGYDMVIGSRYLAGARSDDDDAVTAFGNWMFTKMVNILFRADYTDVLVMMRGWKKELFKNLPDPGLAGGDMMMSIYCAKRRLKVAEIPADEPARIGGERKMNPFWNGLAVLWLIIKEFFTR